ncbi:hypothetical protein ACH4PU_31160 [Streptomyces sp. NPDC021100]|uniref:hypothetical protein n=1 Tax=Streptomyces sp. NPDC021100 TaxID=3365114 RepID=UPI0037A8CDE1
MQERIAHQKAEELIRLASLDYKAAHSPEHLREVAAHSGRHGAAPARYRGAKKKF